MIDFPTEIRTQKKNYTFFKFSIQDEESFAHIDTYNCCSRRTRIHEVVSVISNHY